MNRFTDKTALITGAAGDIGRAAAVRFAQEGASVVLFDRREDLLDESRAACEQAGAPAVSCYGVDQTDEDAVAEAVAMAAASGGLDVLFANAGYGQMATFLETTSKSWNRHVDVNLTGTFHVCQHVARAMALAERSGSIVINASSGAVQHADHLSAYCATKAGLRMLAIGMASELGVHRIRVNSVMPGVIETGMTAPMLADDGHRQGITANTPAGRLGQADDVAALVCFLASDEAGFINGESVMVDGGQTIHGHPRWFKQDYRTPHRETWEVGS